MPFSANEIPKVVYDAMPATEWTYRAVSAKMLHKQNQAISQETFTALDTLVDTIRQELSEYHLIDDTSISQRVKKLERIRKLLQETLRWDGFIHLDSSKKEECHFFNLYNALLYQVGNKLNYLENVIAFYSLPTDEGSPQNRIDVKSDYVFEAFDPYHRPFGNADIAAVKEYHSYRKNCGSHKKPHPFFIWLETLPSNHMAWKNTNLIVQYFSEAERTPFELRVEDGIVMQGTEPFDTLAFTGKEAKFGAFVVQDNRIFAIEHKVNNIHHTSMANGKPVDGAGMIKVEQGHVTEITNLSGHYKPTLDEFYETIKFLIAKGMVDSRSEIGSLIPTQIVFFNGPGNKQSYSSAREFIQAIDALRAEPKEVIAEATNSSAPVAVINEAEEKVVDTLSKDIISLIQKLSATLNQTIHVTLCDPSLTSNQLNKAGELVSLSEMMSVLSKEIRNDARNRTTTLKHGQDYCKQLTDMIEASQTKVNAHNRKRDNVRIQLTQTFFKADKLGIDAKLDYCINLLVSTAHSTSVKITTTPRLV